MTKKTKKTLFTLAVVGATGFVIYKLLTKKASAQAPWAGIPTRLPANSPSWNVLQNPVLRSAVTGVPFNPITMQPAYTQTQPNYVQAPQE